jgi:hypothetical protein
MRPALAVTLVVAALGIGFGIGISVAPAKAQANQSSDRVPEIFHSASEQGGIAYRWDFTNMTVTIAESTSGQWERVSLKERRK